MKILYGEEKNGKKKVLGWVHLPFDTLTVTFSQSLKTDKPMEGPMDGPTTQFPELLWTAKIFDT